MDSAFAMRSAHSCAICWKLFSWNHHYANAQGNWCKFSKKKSLGGGVVAIASRFQLSFKDFTWKISFVFIRNSKRKLSEANIFVLLHCLFSSRFIYLVHQLFVVWYSFYSFTKYCMNALDRLHWGGKNSHLCLRWVAFIVVDISDKLFKL